MTLPSVVEAAAQIHRHRRALRLPGELVRAHPLHADGTADRLGEHGGVGRDVVERRCGRSTPRLRGRSTWTCSGGQPEQVGAASRRGRRRSATASRSSRHRGARRPRRRRAPSWRGPGRGIVGRLQRLRGRRRAPRRRRRCARSRRLRPRRAASRAADRRSGSAPAAARRRPRRLAIAFGRADCLLFALGDDADEIAVAHDLDDARHSPRGAVVEALQASPRRRPSSAHRAARRGRAASRRGGRSWTKASPPVSFGREIDALDRLRRRACSWQAASQGASPVDLALEWLGDQLADRNGQRSRSPGALTTPSPSGGHRLARRAARRRGSAGQARFGGGLAQDRPGDLDALAAGGTALVGRQRGVAHDHGDAIERRRRALRRRSGRAPSAARCPSSTLPA